MRGSWTAVLAASLLLVVLVAGDVPPSLLNAVAAASNSSLLWGPYRPNLYFGVRPRIPQSLLMGLMWAKVDNFATVQNSGLLRTPKLLFDLNSMLIICTHRLQTHLRTT